jgi:hypothetical protein
MHPDPGKLNMLLEVTDIAKATNLTDATIRKRAKALGWATVFIGGKLLVQESALDPLVRTVAAGHALARIERAKAVAEERQSKKRFKSWLRTNPGKTEAEWLAMGRRKDGTRLRTGCVQDLVKLAAIGRAAKAARKKVLKDAAKTKASRVTLAVATELANARTVEPTDGGSGDVGKSVPWFPCYTPAVKKTASPSNS